MIDPDILREFRVIPVVSIPDSGQAVELADALGAGGLAIVEITLRTEAGLDAIRLVHDQRPDMILLAGTVTTPEAAQQAIDAGAAILVSPALRASVIAVAREANVPIIAGAATPTEVDQCIEIGLPLIKFFPAEAAGGPSFLKAIHGPYPQARFIPTGGVSPDNMERYLSLPNVVAVAGTWIAPPAALIARDFAQITATARDAVNRAVSLTILTHRD